MRCFGATDTRGIIKRHSLGGRDAEHESAVDRV
jgi:hypothetical protein